MSSIAKLHFLSPVTIFLILWYFWFKMKILNNRKTIWPPLFSTNPPFLSNTSWHLLIFLAQESSTWTETPGSFSPHLNSSTRQHFPTFHIRQHLQQTVSLAVAVTRGKQLIWVCGLMFLSILHGLRSIS